MTRRNQQKRIQHPEYAEIARTITQRREQVGYSIPKIAEQEFKYLGFKNFLSAQNFMQNIERGHIYGASARYGYVARSGRTGRRTQCEKLARYLCLLQIKRTDELLKAIKEKEPRFHYPPEYQRQLKQKKSLETRVEEQVEPLEKEVHTILQQQRAEQQRSIKGLARVLHKKLGLGTQESTKDYIKRVLAGRINGRQQPSATTMQRTAYIFQELQIAPEHPLIAKIKEHYPEFNYPPEEQNV